MASYALITPARNEAEFIELTIKSVVAQTFRPVRWVIVSDGSTDATDDIVTNYIGSNPWIGLLRLPERKERHFAGKVHAFNAGWAELRSLNPSVIGNLDADVSLGPDHFDYLVRKFDSDPALGVCGSPFGRDHSNTTIGSRISKMSGVVANCSGENVTKRSVDILPLRAVVSTISRWFPQESKDGRPGRLPIRYAFIIG